MAGRVPWSKMAEIVAGVTVEHVQVAIRETSGDRPQQPVWVMESGRTRERHWGLLCSRRCD
jgi:hypothetical protein